MQQTVPSKSTANVTYQDTARSRVPQAVLSRSTDGSYYQRMDSRRPRISSYSPSSRSSTTRAPHRPQRPKKIVKLIWVKKGSTVGSQAVLPQTVKKSAMLSPKQTWKPKGKYLDSGNPEEDLKDYAIIDSGCSGSMTGDKDKLSDFKDFQSGYEPLETDSNSGSTKHKSFCGITCFGCKGNKVKLSYGTEAGACQLQKSNKEENTAWWSLMDASKSVGFFLGLQERIKREYSIARTPQQNGVAERKNRTLIEAARTMLADSLLPIQFWAEAVNTACYVLNRVVTRKVQDCLHVNFLENQENQKGKGPDWMFDLDLLTPSMNYIPVRKENYADSKEQGITCDDAEDLDDQQFIVHTTQYMPPVESTAAKEGLLLKEKQRDSDDDTPTDGVFSTNSFDAEEGGVADYNNLDSTIDVPSTPTLRIHKIHPQSQIIGKSTAGVQTRRKLQDSTSNQHQALLSFIYKQNRTNHKDSKHASMQEELLQFKLQEVWVLCDLPEGKRVIGTKWVFRNKRDERGTIIKNKARLVAQGYRQEEGVDYDEVFAPVARIEAIRLFLAFASFMGFIVYQMDVKSAFLYGNITEEVYVKQPPGFEDPAHPNKVYRVVKALYGLHQAPRACQDKYVKDILNKFDFRTIKPASTPIEAHKSLGKDEEGENVDVHLYRFQVTPKFPHLHAVKRIFRRPLSGGIQYLGKDYFLAKQKQTIVAISSTEAEYVAAASCCAQVLWMQNQLLDYGFNFMHTEIHIDNESTICIVKNPVFHSKTSIYRFDITSCEIVMSKGVINVVKVHKLRTMRAIYSPKL
ncbi:retrovirus-related pol polyprotein from transposon TNT 1-94 [Tanacetum coccineum]